MRTLLAAGANVRVRDTANRRPVDYALTAGNKKKSNSFFEKKSKLYFFSIIIIIILELRQLLVSAEERVNKLADWYFLNLILKTKIDFSLYFLKILIC